MVLEEGPRNVHEGMKSIVGLANDYYVVGEEDTADVDGVVQVDA